MVQSGRDRLMLVTRLIYSLEHFPLIQCYQVDCREMAKLKWVSLLLLHWRMSAVNQKNCGHAPHSWMMVRAKVRCGKFSWVVKVPPSDRYLLADLVRLHTENQRPAIGTSCCWGGPCFVVRSWVLLYSRYQNHSLGLSWVSFLDESLLPMFCVAIDERAWMLGHVLSSQQIWLNVFVPQAILRARENFWFDWLTRSIIQEVFSAPNARVCDGQ